MWSDILWTCSMLCACVSSSVGQLCFLEHLYETNNSHHYHESDDEFNIVVDDTQIDSFTHPDERTQIVTMHSYNNPILNDEMENTFIMV